MRTPLSTPPPPQHTKNEQNKQTFSILTFNSGLSTLPSFKVLYPHARHVAINIVYSITVCTIIVKGREPHSELTPN